MARSLAWSSRPAKLDGATVLAFCDVSNIDATGNTRHYVNGVLATRFSGLALARYDPASEIQLFYCDADWNVLTDTLHDSVDEATEQAAFEFGPLTSADVPAP